MIVSRPMKGSTALSSPSGAITVGTKRSQTTATLPLDVLFTRITRRKLPKAIEVCVVVSRLTRVTPVERCRSPFELVDN